MYVHNPYDFEITDIGEYIRLKIFWVSFCGSKIFLGTFLGFSCAEEVVCPLLVPLPRGYRIIPIQFTT